MRAISDMAPSCAETASANGRTVTVTTAAGIPLLDADHAPLLTKAYDAGGDPGPIVTALAHVPEVLEAAMPFISVVLGPSSITLRRTELVTLRTSARLGCRYCVRAHTVVAADAGLSRAELQGLRGESPVEGAFVDATELVVLRWVDAVAASSPVDSSARDALGARLPTHEVVELTMLIGATMMHKPVLHGAWAAHGIGDRGPPRRVGAVVSPVADAIAAGVMPGQVWMYSNYHCNLACAYCLTESSPHAERRC